MVKFNGRKAQLCSRNPDLLSFDDEKGVEEQEDNDDEEEMVVK